MEDKREYKSLDMPVDELQVSNTNPRFINPVLDEAAAIRELIKLETNKMVKLTKNVIDNGFLPLPFYCFMENGKTVLADGNRRLTVIKILKNPKLIPNIDRYKELIDLCSSASDLHIPELLPCVVYNEWSDNLFNVLSSLHVSDESKSDWTPLAQYRMSSRHGGNKHSWMKTLLHYFTDDEVDEMTDKKADVFRRMFDAFKPNGITITDSGELNIDKPKEKLRTFAKLIKSNIVNTRTKVEDFKSKVKEVFIDGESGVSANYTFTIDKNHVYETQAFDISKCGIKICFADSKPKKCDCSLLKIVYTSPTGEIRDDIDTTVLGEWGLDVEYEGFKGKLHINVLKRLETTLELTVKKASSPAGESVYLRDFIRSASNAFGENVIDKVKIKLISKQNVTIENDTLSGDAEQDIYTFQYQYKDSNGECSKTFFVEITDNKEYLPLFGKIEETGLFSWGDASISISYNNTVAALINEINSLDYKKYANVICCSCRAIIEISYDVMVLKSKIPPTTTGSKSLEIKLKEIVAVLLANLNTIRDGDPVTFPSFNDEKNFLVAFTDSKIKALNGKLNGGAHKSGKGINLDEMKESIKKDLSRLVVLINQFLK